MCGPKFCSMKITQEVREYADRMNIGLQDSIDEGMKEKDAVKQAPSREAVNPT